jgi:Fructose-2,6-bisphosphatase
MSKIRSTEAAVYLYTPAMNRDADGLPRAFGARVADAAFFAPLKAAASFYIVRHGQSEGNAKGLVQGHLDMPLDEEGRAQARDAAAWLATRGIEAAVASPLSRAAETGRIITAACGLELEFEPLLEEIDAGLFTGLTFPQAQELYPEAWAAFKARSWAGVPGAESSEALYSRALSVWAALRDRAASGAAAVACITHGGLIQWLLHATFGWREWMPLVATSNCGIFELYVEPGSGGGAYMQWRLVNFVAPASAR